MNKIERQEFQRKIEITKCFDGFSYAQSKIYDNYHKKFYTVMLSDGRQIFIKMDDDAFVEMMGFDLDNITPLLMENDKKSIAISKQKYGLVNETLKGNVIVDKKRCLNRYYAIRDLSAFNLYNIVGFIDIDEDTMICLIANQNDYYTSIYLKRKNDQMFNIYDIRNVDLSYIFTNRNVYLPVALSTIKKEENQYNYYTKEITDEQLQSIIVELEDIGNEYNISIVKPTKDVFSKKLELIK